MTPARRFRSHTLRIFAYLVVALLSAVVAFAASWLPFARQLELRTYDYRFKLRGPLPENATPPVTLVLIDEASLQRIPDPLMLWHGYFGDMLNGIADAGASVVGIDFLFSDIEKINSEAARHLNEALIRTNAQRMPVVLAYRVTESGVELPPSSLRIAAAEGGHAFGFVNLTSDTDDFVRRQTIRASAQPGAAVYSPSFPLAIADIFQKNAGRRLPDVPADTILINFRERGAFPRVSFSDVLEAAKRNDLPFLRQAFGGRIVLIAAAGGRGNEDMHSTPHYYWSESREYGLRTPGVEIHANTIATLLAGDAIREAGTGFQSLLTLLSAVVVTVIWRFLRTTAATLLTVVWIILFGAAALWLFHRGIWIWVVSPAAACICAVGMTQSANYIFEGRERRRVHRLFGRYVSNKIIEQLLDSPIEIPLGGERRRVAVLFADIRAFTTRCESAKPEDIVALLNEYFTEIIGVIQNRGGTVNSLMGDGLMSIFGAPIADADAAHHAVLAAQEMMHGVERLNSRLASRGMAPLRIGIGINAGDAVIGNIGSPQMMEYSAIGDVVNTASRIEGKTRELNAGILIGQPVFDWLAGRIPAEHRGEIHVQGRAGAVPVYEVPWNSSRSASQSG